MGGRRWELKLEDWSGNPSYIKSATASQTHNQFFWEYKLPLPPRVCSYLIDKATSRCNYCDRPHNVFRAYTPPSARPTHIVAELKYNKYTKYSTLLPAKTIRRMSSNTCFFEQITQLYTIFLRSWETLRKPHTFPTTLLPTQYKINWHARVFCNSWNKTFP